MIRKISCFLLLCFALFGLTNFCLADDLENQCAQVTESGNGCGGNMSTDDCKTLLQKCADYYDQQSVALAEDITKTAAQKSTLQSAITKLKSKISSLQASINQSKVMVKDLNIQITDTQESISKTTEQIEDSQAQLKEILRSVYEEDQKPSFFILLEGNLSDFFSNLVYLDSLNSKVSDLLGNTKNLKTYLTGQQEKMSNNVDQLQKTIALQTLQKQQNEQNQKEQAGYLKLTEAQYQEQLSNKTELETKKAKIQAMLFSLAGTDDTEAPSFGEAIEIAKKVGNMVGIRPAFLLAIISQESAIGRNVGQCYLVDSTTGSGKKISTGATVIRIMKPTRDVKPFIEITTALGKDPYSTPVSCWIPAYVGGVPYGWGGAMGPAQFIASTWMLFQSRLTILLGKTPNPWAIKDAFTASGLYLADLGATAQTSAKESNAASRYYGGSSAYARSVMSRASCIQSFIDSGTMSTSCQNLIF